jgi:hypothetical protein
MIGGEDPLFRPVLRGILAPERLIDGSVDLEFVMLLNEAIAVEDENSRRAEKWAREQPRPGGGRRT